MPSDDDFRDEIRQYLKNDKLVVGTNTVLKALRNGSLKKVFLASNCVDNTDEVKRYASLMKTELVRLPFSNEELGVLCKKPFLVCTVGVLK